MTQAIKTFGVLLKAGDGGDPEAFTAVAEVKNVGGPSFSRDGEDATHHQSSGAWEESVPTILRSGEISLEVNLIPADPTHDASTGVLADLVGGDVRNWQLVLPDTDETTWSFAGYVNKYETGFPVSGVLTASIGIKLTGQPTLA